MPFFSKTSFIKAIRPRKKGVQEFRDSPSRIEKAKAAVAAAGGEMKSFHVTLGRYDMIAVIEAPNDAAYAKVMLALASKGGVRTETLLAFTEDEFRDIVKAAT